ncbi:SDR family NAD(P)-dependent oxidoreductase [Rhodoluna limnophila]|uniref:SDR family NAD(P)-dependent oxidoreductase n=1 Tax=Rhodoluna limnophila TaxID=232537 RepID=UPI001105C97F|nr:SDR family NAD(P)-dependent oxidoreductase [Rhodoluna limnophila]
MSELQGRQILVVGASGAFGNEFCTQLEASGAKVIGTARNADSAARLQPQLEQRLLLNLEDPQSIQTLANYLRASQTSIDGVVLASGLVAFGSVAETSSAVLQRLTQVNTLGQIDLVQQLLPSLVQSSTAGRSPFVVSISGVIAERPMAGLSAYSASKAALHAYATAAQREYQKLGIRWLDARPGHTESGLANRAIAGTAPNFGAGMTVEHVIRRIIKAVLDDEKDLPSGSF